MAQRTLRSIGVVAAAAVLAAALAGCGSEAPSPPPPAADPKDPFADIRAAAAPWFERWAGSTESRQAAEILRNYRMNGRYSECMRSRGYDIPWEHHVQLEIRVDGLARSVWTRAPYFRFQSRELIRRRIQDPIVEDEGDDAPRIADADYRACHGPGTPPVSYQVRSQQHPPKLPQLTSEWGGALAKATVAIGTSDDYYDCLAEYALPGKPAGSHDFDAQFWAMDAAETDTIGHVPTDGSDGDAVWQAFVAKETQILDADWECRADVYAEAMSSVEDTITTFEAEHADQIAALAAYWRSVEADARALGWTPEKPFGSITPDDWDTSALPIM